LKIYLNIAADDPAELLETLSEGCRAELSLRIVLRIKHQRADPPHSLGLLCVRSQRPSGCYAAKRDNKFSSPDTDRHAVAPRNKASSAAEVYGSPVRVSTMRQVRKGSIATDTFGTGVVAGPK
jgi:hypothetical protein